MISKLVFLLNKSNSLVYSNHTLKLNFPNKFVKFGFSNAGKQLLDKEYFTFCNLENCSFSEMIPEKRYANIFGIRKLEIETLKPVARDFSLLKPIYQKFNSHAKIQDVSVLFPTLTSWYGKSDVVETLQKFRGMDLNIGMIHGDFHLNNIMRSHNGKLKIIDLDLFKENWFREFDLINILVSELILGNGYKWKEAFQEAFSSQDMLTAVDAEWETRTKKEKSILFYLYFVTRSMDEFETLTSEEHNSLLRMLELNFDK